MPDVRSFNIEAYKARFGDGAKSSLFYFQPQWPAGINPSIGQEDAIYLVKTATLPSTTIEEVILNWQGLDYKFGGKKTFTDVTITFNVDKKAEIRETFEQWSNLCHDPESNFFGTHDTYMVDQKLQMLGYQGEVILEFNLHDAWPKEISQVTMDYSSTEIATFDVSFTYIYHTLSFTETGN